MSILTKVEAKGWRGRVFLAGVTLLLTVGGATMVYPFLLMLSGAMRSDMDASSMAIIPEYFREDSVLVRKFLETKYNYNPILMNRFRRSRNYNFRSAAVPDRDSISDKAVADFEEFLASPDFPSHWRALGGTKLYRLMSSANHRRMVATLREKFDDDLTKLNTITGAPVHSWGLISQPMPRWGEARTIMPSHAPAMEACMELAAKSPAAEVAVVDITGLFFELMAYPAHGMTSAKAFVESWQLPILSYNEFSLPQRAPSPEHAAARKDWLDFVLGGQLNLSFVRCDAADTDYQTFLKNKYRNIDDLKQYWDDAEYESFDDVKLPSDKQWVPRNERKDYGNFLATLAPESLRLVAPEFAWRDFLKKTYGDIATAAAAHGTDYRSWDECRMPVAQSEAKFVFDNSTSLRRRYTWRNFGIVLNQMFVQGRSFANTIIYVSLALLFALTLQPMVAYALSRFQPPGTWKLIFIFVATMAFPPMVGMIPQFLMIQKLNLLNTFIALVLPITINGMMIFLLKGFFDSIPKDLYDAAVIDGASEFMIFWKITMSMSTPILAVVGLRTFTAAWMSFMYPLIVCPDEKMHVLAVWLQQFNQQASGTAVFAAIIIASLPSLIIFIFAQRVIMRGIAVPSEK